MIPKICKLYPNKACTTIRQTVLEIKCSKTAPLNPGFIIIQSFCLQKKTSEETRSAKSIVPELDSHYKSKQKQSSKRGAVSKKRPRGHENIDEFTIEGTFKGKTITYVCVSFTDAGSFTLAVKISSKSPLCIKKHLKSKQYRVL